MILVVEDNELIIEWMRDEIQKAGYYFDEAADANAALYKINRLEYALILIDIGLPDMHGDELAKLVKDLPEPICATPMVAMTGGTYAEPVGAEVFAAVLRKPFLPGDLREAIGRYARPPVPDLHRSTP